MSKPIFRFGTVGSPKSTPKKPGGSVGAIIHLRSIGLDAFELGWVRSVRVSEKTCQEIKASSVEHDVALSIHAPYFINLNANSEEWPKSRKRLMDAAHYGNLAGATEIIFHPGSYFGKPPDIERLNGCMDEIRSGGNSSTLRPETMGESAMLGSLGDVLTMSAAIKGVEPCLDLPHLYARTGDDGMNTYKEWMLLLEQYGSVLGEESLKRLHVHLSGIEYGPKGERKHLPIADSELDMDAILQALNDLRCGGRIVCESPILEEDAVRIREMWSSLAAGKKGED